MTSAVDAFALVLELLTLVGLVPGIVLLVVGYTRRALAGRYEQTWGVIVASPAGTAHPWFRWMDLARELQSSPVTGGEEALTIGDEVTVYFDPRNPQNGRLDDPSGDGRALRVIGWLLAGIGAAAGIVQLIVLFME